MRAPYLQPYAVPNSSTVSIDAATTIDASATETGNGGKVIVWANQATTFLGTILAQGGAQSGNGGFVETSGGTLTYNGTVNTSAPNGKTGTWLLDPTDLTIDEAGAATIETASPTMMSLSIRTQTVRVTKAPNRAATATLATLLSPRQSLGTSDHTLTLDAYQ